MAERRVVITGIGTINPIGSDVTEFWKNLEAGKSGIIDLKSIYPILEDYPVHMGGYFELPEDVEKYFPGKKKWLKRLDEFIVYMHIAASQAMHDSGLEIDKEDPHRIGALLGSGEGGLNSHERNQASLHKMGMGGISPLYVLNVIPNTATGYFTQSFGLQGPTFAPVSACASASHSIGLCSMLIQCGMADVMFAGASEASLNPSGIGAFGNLGALSVNSANPTTASRPFDRDRDGFIMSNGAGALCLEEYERAKKRGAKIYGEITSYWFSADGYDLVAPDPEAKGSSYAVQACLTKGKLNTEDIDLINAHGTSTPLGDLAEAKGIQKVFGDYGKKVKVHSTKSMTGHTIGASGAIEAIAAVLALEKGIVHPSINCDNQDDEIPINVVKEPLYNQKIKHVMSNNFGFGGQNSVIIISKV